MEKKVTSGMLFSEFFTTTEQEPEVEARSNLSKGKVSLKSNLKQPVERSLKIYKSEQNMIRRKFRSSDKTFFRNSNWTTIANGKRVDQLLKRNNLKEQQKEKSILQKYKTRRIKSNDKNSRKICRIVNDFKKKLDSKGQKKGLLSKKS